MAPSRPIRFAKLVRAELAASRPTYLFTETTGGSGPLVHFAVPTGIARVTQQLVVQKGLYGANWLRVNILTAFVDRGGEDLALIQRTAPKLDIPFTTEDECSAALRAVMPEVDDHLRKDRRTVAALVPPLTVLLDGLPEHAAAWMEEEGTTLAPALFDDDDFAEAACKHFFSWLERKKLWIEEAEQPVWWWWTDHHPKPKAPTKPKAARVRQAKRPAKPKTKSKPRPKASARRK